ncbi:hypothetical protein ABFX02_11G061400 [Erythranthe guttata]
MSKSPWGNVGNWAAEAERAEAEEREAAEKEAAAAAAAQSTPSFPSLKEAVTTATKQKKKTKMTLHEFRTQDSPYSGSAPSRGLTPDEMFRLPTRPKERSPDEMQHGRLGGGFSNYGTRSAGPNQGRDQQQYDGRRSYGFQEDERRGGPPQPRIPEMNQPSRADEVDNWASMKKPIVPEFNSGQARPGGKYSSLGAGGSPGAGSRADEVDSWASAKKPIPQPHQQGSRSSSFGSGYSRPESDRWTRNEQRSVLDSPKIEADVVVKVNKPNPFGAARPREEVLAEKGLDWKKMDLETEGKKPASSQSSRPESPVLTAGEGEVAVKQKPKVNPFGDAKPREVLLQEKGLDWKKIDLELEHRRVERSETEEERKLKEEIEQLKKELLLKSDDDQTTINDLILQKERELELLVLQLDDKIRYTQKNFERQGSAAGGAYENPRAALDRPPSQGERPPSRHGAYEDPHSRPGSRDRPRSRPGSAYDESRGGNFPQRSSSFTTGAYQDPNRGVDFVERPRSRGTVNSWARPSDDTRATQGGGGRGFFGSRDVDRSGSRW